MAKHILRYLKGTIDYRIIYSKRSNTLRGYVDSNWTGNIDDRKLCSESIFILADKLGSEETKICSTMYNGVGIYVTI